MIRKATQDDLPGLARLFDAYRVFYRKESDLEAASDFLSQRMKNNDSVVYVAESDQELAGFVQLYPLFSSTRMQRLWLLNDLFVSPDFRGKGISVQLIDQAKELARQTNAAGLTLETEKSNVIGNQLYPRTGFDADDAHTCYFWENKER
ncbi:MAG: GNAT family N-acetyltransferase [Bacteroidota bacterium]